VRIHPVQSLAVIRRLRNRSLLSLPLLFASLLFAPGALAETIRVATWNLQPANERPGFESSSTGKMAEALKPLSADIILLQGMSDWRACAHLVQALEPEPYRVSICSALRGAPSGGPTNQEVAILSRYKTLSCWWKPWDASGPEAVSAGAFAFAAIQVRKRCVGVFCAEFANPAQGAASSATLLGQIETVKGWTHNEVDTFIVGGTCMSPADSAATPLAGTMPGLEQRGFLDACLGLPLPVPPGRPVPDFVYVDQTGFPINPQRATTSAGSHPLVICEIELEPGMVAAARIAHAQERARLAIDNAAKEREANIASREARAASAVIGRQAWFAGVMGGVLLILLAVIWRMARQKRLDFPHPAGLLPAVLEAEDASSSSYNLVIAPDAVTATAGKDPEAETTSGASIRIAPSPATQTQSAAWQRRALAAERRAERAHSIIRKGLLPQLRHWLQQKLVRKLMADRAQLLEAQRAATLQAQTVDERLSRVEHQIQQQNRIYERRIEELTLELLATKEENRELIRSRIAHVRAEMEAAAARVRAQARQTQPDH
jgi:hypothetical protein